LAAGTQLDEQQCRGLGLRLPAPKAPRREIRAELGNFPNMLGLGGSANGTGTEVVMVSRFQKKGRTGTGVTGKLKV
jgi:hypothetical protein